MVLEQKIETAVFIGMNMQCRHERPFEGHFTQWMIYESGDRAYPSGVPIYILHSLVADQYLQRRRLTVWVRWHPARDYG